MTELTSKPPELLQAQVAAFAAEGIQDYHGMAHVFNNVGAIAVGPVEDTTRTVTAGEYHNDENGNRVVAPEGTKKLVATSEEYIDFIRSVGGSSYEPIKSRADILGAYSPFASTVDRLRRELADPRIRKEHPAHLGSGLTSAVFEVSRRGKQFAVRVPHGNAIQPRIIDGYVAGMALGRGVPRLEQIVAASYEDGVTVAEKMPGKEVGRLTASEVRAITVDQVRELVDTLIVAHKHNIHIDPKPSNFLYDPEAGYGIVDYYSKVSDSGYERQDLSEVIGWGAGIIKNAGFYGRPDNAEKVPEDYAHDAKLYEANLIVLKYYRTIVEQKLTGAEQDTALKVIDPVVQTIKATITNYSDPAWTTQQIVQNREWARRRAEQAAKAKPKISADGWITIESDIIN